MRYIFIICLLLVSHAALTQVVDNKSFTVKTCTSKQIFGGVAGSGSTTSYSLSIKVLKSGKYAFDSGWAEGRADRLYMQVKTREGMRIVDFDSIIYLKKGTVCTIILGIHSPSYDGPYSEREIIPGSPVVPAPVKNKPVVIRYRINGKAKYAVSQVCKQLEPLFAP